MLALTYPDGSRVQRCDNLPERPARVSNLLLLRHRRRCCHAEDPLLLTWSSYDASRRRGRRASASASATTGDDGGRGESRDGDHPRLSEAEATTLPPSDDDHPSTRRTTTTTTTRRRRNNDRRDHTRSSSSTNSSHHQPDADPRRLSPPPPFFRTKRSSSSWHSGAGRPAKDPCLLQVLLVLVLLAVGCNRHCGPFGSKVNRTAFGALAIGSVIAGAGCAPVDIITDTGVRSERSANLSHITGTSRKIRMHVMNRLLQILPDGTVNGSDDVSDYTILQRVSVAKGHLRIQGVATCLFLCMDACGILYGSPDYTMDCVFNETMENHNYNTYSSVRWSTPRKTLYLGLRKNGQPRKVQTKGHEPLGRLAVFAEVLTSGIPQEQVDALQSRLLGARHGIRHHHGGQKSVCPTSGGGGTQERDGRDKFRCRKRKKRKKRRRRCRPGEAPIAENCDARETGVETHSKRSCEGAAVDEACRREALEAPAKKRKSRIGGDGGGPERKKPRRKKNAAASSSSVLGQKKNGGGGRRNKGASSRTTRNLGSSLAMTSPLSWLRIAPSSTESSADYSARVPKPAAASLSAVSVAATSLASTLTLTLTSSTATALGIAPQGEEVGGGGGGGGETDYIKTEAQGIDGNGFFDDDAGGGEDDDEEDEEDEREERDYDEDGKTRRRAKVLRKRKIMIESQERLAM